VETDELIRYLADRATPVGRLPAPWRRTTLWLAISLAYILAVVLVYLVVEHGSGPIDIRLAVEELATVATAITAAIAAFSLTVPGRDRRICLLPLVPLAFWLLSLGEGCLHDWLSFGTKGLDLRADWDCVPPALILAIVPAALMVAMLRHGAPLEPRLSFALAVLAIASLVNFGLRIFHAGDITIMLLVWHFGVGAVIAALAGQFGRAVLDWPPMIALGEIPSPARQVLNQPRNANFESIR
jgi:hypothetical protein